MRKLKLQTQVSIDGYCAGPNGEMDFMVWNWDDNLRQFTRDLTAPINTILLGRKLAEGFIPYWESVVANPEHPEHEGGKMMVTTPKVVFSKTLSKSTWNNTTVATGELVEEVKKLKNQPGGDIIAYGGSDFVANLIKNNLIDEYYIFVNPTAIGTGLPIFKDKAPLKLVKAYPFECGIVVLNYKPVTQ